MYDKKLDKGTIEQQIDGWMDRKYIRNYALEWQNLWCHGTWDINDTNH